MQTGLSAWVFAIVRALEDAGVDPAELMRGIGMAPDKLGDLSHRYSQEQVTSLWISAVATTGDSNFGLKVARHIRPSTFHVVGYAMSCSSTLKRAAERFAHSARLISDAAAVDFSGLGEDYLLKVDLHTGGRQPIYQTIDTILAGFLMLCEWIQSAPIVPLEVKFRHRKPLDESDYLQIFRCPVRYGQKENSILFRGQDLEQPVPSANEELAMLLDEMAARHLAYRFASRFSTKVRDALVGQLPNGEPSKQETARLLGMTERTLLRRLRDENTTFQELLDRLREKLAFDYLRRDDLTMEKIAYRCRPTAALDGPMGAPPPAFRCARKESEDAPRARASAMKKRESAGCMGALRCREKRLDLGLLEPGDQLATGDERRRAGDAR